VSELAGTRRLRGAMTQRLQRELAAHLAAETKRGGSSA
jgi:hypothetical protein